MHAKFAKTLLTASALVTGILASALAYAGTRGQAPVAISTLAHNGPRDAYTDGALTGQAGSANAWAPGRQGLSACASRNFDPFQGGMRTGPRDPFSDGGRGSQADPYSSGAECLTSLNREPGSGPGGAGHMASGSALATMPAA